MSINCQPLVTLVMPTIGRPKYLGKVLESIYRQTYPNLEIIISDNHSDISVNIDSFRGKFSQNVILVRREKRLSFATHFNACIEEASGKYVFFVSDDDYVHPELISNAIEVLESDDKISCVMPGQFVIDENWDGGVENLLREQKIFNGADFIRKLLIGDLAGQVRTLIPLIARKCDLVIHGGFADYAYGAHSDNILFIRIALNSKVCLLTNTYYYRVYSGSVGLSMPWMGLYCATRIYDKDFIYELTRVKLKFPSAIYLYFIFHKSNCKLLLSRLVLSSSRQRKSIFSLIVSLLLVFSYLSFLHRFYAFPKERKSCRIFPLLLSI